MTQPNNWTCPFCGTQIAWAMGEHIKKHTRLQHPEMLPVGDGPFYAPVREAAHKLIPLFYPAGLAGSSGNFGLGLWGSVQPEKDKHHLRPSVLSYNQLTLPELRAIAIGLLVYCEAHDDSA